LVWRRSCDERRSSLILFDIGRGDNSKQVSLTPDDARMLWAVFRAIAQRLL
jgi:hypothetical protein